MSIRLMAALIVAAGITSCTIKAVPLKGKYPVGPFEVTSEKDFEAVWSKTINKLGIDTQKGLYSWKHSGVCYYYYLTNKDIYAVMRQLRHRDLSTTMIYLKSMGLIQNDAFRNAMVA